MKIITASTALLIGLFFSTALQAQINTNYSFVCGSAYIEVPDSPSLDSTTDQLTLECWFNRSTLPDGDWNAIISRDLDDYDSVDYELRFFYNQPSPAVHFESGDALYPQPDINPIFPAWHHYALQFDGTNVSVWLDGESIYSTNTSPDQLMATENPLSIGCQNSGFRPFNGYIDEVRISRVARYHSAFNPQMRFSPDADTVALYHLDENGGTIAHDASGNGNDGTIYNADSTTWSTYVPAVVSGALITIKKAVYVSFSNLLIGTNYQVQVSTNLSGPWTNSGSAFTATRPTLDYSNYWNVSDWDQLYFRLTQP